MNWKIFVILIALAITIFGFTTVIERGEEYVNFYLGGFSNALALCYLIDTLTHD